MALGFIYLVPIYDISVPHAVEKREQNLFCFLLHLFMPKAMYLSQKQSLHTYDVRTEA